jgi:4'-phosphopantetheinyl transferase
MVACAVIRGLPIGVDLESSFRQLRHRELAERFFGEDEVKALRALAPERQAARFLELWTLKEAYLKAVGRGISVPLRGFQFQLCEADPPRIHFDPALSSDDAASWQFALRRPGGLHTLALAIRCPGRSPIAIRLFDVAALERAFSGPEAALD